MKSHVRIAAASKFAGLGLILLLAAGCTKRGDIDSAGQGIIQFRSSCPVVGFPARTADITLHDPAPSRHATAADVVADITNIQSNCATVGDEIRTSVTYTVNALRRDGGAARTVNLPVFSTVVRGGTSVVAKRVATIQLSFAQGAVRASANGSATSSVNRAEATLPDDVQRRITRPRKSGDADAALDPRGVSGRARGPQHRRALPGVGHARQTIQPEAPT
mgnify:CR=1 FL=1